MKNLLKNASIVILLVIIATASLSCQDKQTKEETSNEVQFLLVQNADGMTLSDGQLRLKNIAPTTLYFSDRPDRIVGRVTTKEYVDHWSVGDNNFKADPPNAVISVISGTEVEDITVVLTEPRLEGADLVYNVNVLDGSTNIVGGETALFIDVVGRPLTPLSVAGVARRSARRTVRRRM
jgi:hypothetical protein